jgi:two-component system phosphate regulon sensor histidine kinase PhoR
MRRRSLFTKLFLGNLLLVIVIIAISGVASYHYLNASYQDEVEAQHRRTVRIMQRYFRHLWSRDPDRIDAECGRLFEDATMRLTVIAADGRVLGDSQADPATMVNHRTDDRPEVLAALRGQSGRAVRTSETLGVAYRYFAEPIEKDGQVVGTARVAMPVRAVAEGSSLIRNALFWSALMAAVVAVVLALLLSWIWYSPLRRITRAARKIASGNIHGRVRISGSYELAQLGAALNDMAASLAEKIRQVDVQRRSLDTVVRNLREGVVALDAQGHVVVMNAYARELLEVREDDVQGRQLQEVVRIADVVTTFGRVVEAGEPVRKQIEREAADVPKTLDLLAVPVTEPASEGIRSLLVVRDITEQAQTARVKSEFAANASHELRTPLATIRAAVDSLGTVGPDSREEFNTIRNMLDRHTRRLEEMTDDLMSLHTIETAKQQLRLEQIEAGSLLKWAQEHFAPQTAQKGVALEILTADPSRTFTADLTLLQLILQNLIDNAIKFTPASGRVECRLEVADDRAVLRVSDTGCGIPPELQDRVFERFFQVEPSRSSGAKPRGTGLGLAIVKHAAERLGGTVALQSELGRGTVVEVRVPLSPPAACPPGRACSPR